MFHFKKLPFFCILAALSTNILSQDTEGDVGYKITGSVIDASTNLSIEGIGVSVPGVASTFSDSSGVFSLEVTDKDLVLIFMGPDYQTQEVPLKGRDNITVYLHDNNYTSFNQESDQYYKQIPVIYNPNSVITLDPQERTWKTPGTSVEQLFDGQIPGLNIISRSGVQGIGSNLFMRGFSSIYATNQPLIIVDGFMYENKQYGISIIKGFLSNPLASISINDIENVTVIRDAYSIYGAKASNGIIFIRTNHAYEKVTRIDFSSYGGLNFSPEQIPMLQADDYRRYLTEILQTKGLSPDSILSLPYMIDDPSYPDYFRYHNNTNWQDQVFTNSYNQNINLKISGGDEIALYALSVGYQKHQGTIKNTSYSRYSFRFNSDINISSKLTLNSNISFTFNQHNLKEDGNAPTTNPLYLSFFKSPFTYPHVISSTGAKSPNLENADILGIGNPVAVIEDLYATSNNYKIFGSFNANFQITKHLKVSDLLGINFDKIRDNLFVPHLGIAQDSLDLGVAENEMAHKVERVFMLNNDFRLIYNRSFNLVHNVSGLGGVRIGTNKVQGDWGEDYNSPNDQMRTLGTGVSYLRQIGGYLGEWRWITWYASADYNFRYKYFLSLNFALDGSSRFGEEAPGITMFSGKFGFFPSVAAAWLVSSEKFMSGVDVIDHLKIRASYGITGNDDIGNYSAKKYYVSQNLLGSEGLVKGVLWNPSLKWETNKKLNAGIDLAVLKERISVSFDVFNNITEDLLNIMSADPLSGFDTYLENNGSLKSTGFEFNLNSRILNRNFKWDAGFNVARYQAQIVEFPEDQRITQIFGANILTKPGSPPGLFYGYKTLGVFATQEEAEASGLRALMPNTDLIPFSAGDIHFDDYDGNHIIDENDMQVIGDPNPDLTGMLFNRIEWKGISLEACILISLGNDMYNHLRYMLESMQNTYNQTPVVLNRWRGEGQVTDIPRAVWGDPIGNSRFSDKWIEDGSYARLKYITLTYKIPIKPGFINSLEVFASGQNLVTFTKYLGMDPEVSLSDFSLAQGIDIGLLPQPRSVFMGIKLGL
jgi:TonB-linked SusC/RagA family outer membrane protein